MHLTQNIRQTGAARLAKLAQLTGIPSIIVNEKYKVNISKLKSLTEALSVTDFLIKTEQQKTIQKNNSYVH